MGKEGGGELGGGVQRIQAGLPWGGWFRGQGQTPRVTAEGVRDGSRVALELVAPCGLWVGGGPG